MFARLALLAFAIAAPAFAAEPAETVVLWPKGAPGEKGDIGEEKDQPNKPGDTIRRLSNVSNPTIAVYKPAADKANGAAVLICPGGGYHILAMNHEGTEVAEWLNGLGVTAVLLKYRVPARKGRERYAAPLEDAQRAMGIVRSKAKDWGIDPQRIGVLGFSAGGHLSAVLSNNFTKRTYEAVDAADAVSCRPDFTILIYPAYLTDPKKPGIDLCPEVKVTSETPPACLIHAEDDPVTCESSLFYYLAIKNAKVSGELHIFPTGGHGYGIRPSAHAVSHWPERTEQWMRATGLLAAKK